MPTIEIKAGSVVTLKSSGPKMTVSYISDGVATCFWFVNGELKWNDIRISALKYEHD